jgi:hypothetical protein
MFMFGSRVLCGSGCEPSLVLHKEPQNFEFQRPEKSGYFLRFSWLKTRFLNIDFSDDKRKNGAIFMFRSRVLCGSGCELSLVLHK